MLTRGRCVEHDSENKRVLIRTERGLSEAYYNSDVAPRIGDWISIQDHSLHAGQYEDLGKSLKILTPNRAVGQSTRWMERILDPRRLHAMQVRSTTETEIAQFFLSMGFQSVRTPLLVPCPGMETHIRPFKLETGSYLPTSPEFAMKRLLVGGLEKIFQICPSFRLEPNSTTHHSEFTMLEWYRAFASYEDIMCDTENLVAALARKIHGEETLTYQGKRISVAPPWPRLMVRDLYKVLGVDLVSASSPKLLAQECARLGLSTNPGDTWDDLYFRIWLNLIEPKLPSDQAAFVCRYPASQAALSVVDSDSDGSRWARRFEVYAGGLELANAFEELTDPVEQRRRFVSDMESRNRIYGVAFAPCPIDDEFLQALEEGMPPAAGIALGVDRLVMLLADEPNIEKTRWLDSYVGSSNDS